MASREGFSIWVCLFKKYPNGDRMISRLFQRRFWTSGYVWQDSFSWLIARIWTCRVKGCNPVRVGDQGDPGTHYCFRCYRWSSPVK